MFKLPKKVLETVKAFQKNQSDPISVFVYDLVALGEHARYLISALPDKVDLYYAIKANNEKEILDTLAPIVDGFEISSGGEIAKIQQCSTRKPFIFSGPGKLDSDLETAIHQGVEFIHIESLNEIERLEQVASLENVKQDVLLRVNPNLPAHLSTKLSMAGTATPFGLDELELEQAIQKIEICNHLRLCGFHIHAMSHQTSVDKHVELIQWYLTRWNEWKQKVQNPLNLKHLNVGGGIGVNYLSKEQFDWTLFCLKLEHVLKAFPDAPRIRFEIGRFLSAYCGYYAIEVLDIKTSHAQNFLVCRGGTHQFRLPAAQSHDHPVIHIPQNINLTDINSLSSHPYQRGEKTENIQSYHVVGQLCTPKDVLSRDQQFANVQIGDLLVLPLAGAYGFNISHVDFLCHPRPKQIYIGAD